MELTSALPTWDCTNKKILLRADLNVPLRDGQITNDLRLRALVPTLNLLREKKATIILLTHLGRPQNHDPSLSTQLLIPWFEKHSYPMVFAKSIEEAVQKSSTPYTIVLLENLRFFKGEQNLSESFAKELARLGDFFVQDAFGALHKKETSIVLLPQQFKTNQRTIGLTIEKELRELNRLIAQPEHPYCIILGGSKIKEKIPLIEAMQKKADAILLCPAIVFTFLKAQEKAVGNSVVDNEMIEICKRLIQQNKLMFPTDYLVAQNDQHGALSYSSSIGPDQFGISIGPETIAQYATRIQQAQTVFFNGAIGFSERPETLNGMKALFEAMAQSKGTTIVSGGDSTAALEHSGIKGITYISTGGGSTLYYLSGETLPGLEPFL